MANQEQNQGQSTNLPAVIGNFLGDNRVMLAQYANKSCAMGPFLRSAMLAILNDERLIEAVKSDRGQATLLGALQHAAVTGLSLNPSEGKSCLVVYGQEINYQVMKNGLIEQTMKTGKVKYVMGDVIRERDTAKIIKTMTGDIIEHKMELDERGKIRGFYAALVLADGEQHVTYMTMKEMEEHRDKYAKGLRYNDGNIKKDHAWHKSFEGQGIKTVIRRLLTRTAIAEESSVDEMNKFDEMMAEKKPEPTDPGPDISERFDAAAEGIKTNKEDLPLAGKSTTADPEPPKPGPTVTGTPEEEPKPESGDTATGTPTSEQPAGEEGATKEELDIF